MGAIKAREENKPNRRLFDFVGAGSICALASAIVLAVACVPTPALPQTANVPFGDVTNHVVRLDGVRFHYVTAGSESRSSCCLAGRKAGSLGER